MTRPPEETPAAGSGPEETPAPGSAPAETPAAGASGAPGADAEPTLADDLQSLAQDLRAPVLGAPAQRLTGLLIVALVVIALVIGLTAMQRQGMLTFDSPSATPSPTAALVHADAA